VPVHILDNSFAFAHDDLVALARSECETAAFQPSLSRVETKTPGFVARAFVAVRSIKADPRSSHAPLMAAGIVADPLLE